ncbi:phosphoglycerate dehydrogenase [Niabella terrae]
MSYKIKTLNKIAKSGLEKFGEGYEVIDDTAAPDAILLRSASMHEMEFPESLLSIARAGAGVNNIPIDKCAEKGIVVFNTPGANANAVKELVIASMLISSRKIVDGINWTNGLKENVAKEVEKGKSQFVGPEIEGKTLGVIGLGAIGVLIANAAAGLGMEVLGYDPYISVDAAWGLSRAVRKANDLKTIYENADYITLHVPYNSETKGTLNKEAFAQMKDGVRIINLSRGELIVDADILEAIAAGKVGTYVTDFPNEQMINQKGVIAVPHLGASTPESEDNCAEMAARQTKNYLETGNIKNSVNFPNCALAYGGGARITIAHKNIPNMLGQISTALAESHVNIKDMINKSRGDYAYTIADIESPVGEDVLAKIKGIEGVLKLRVIG